MKIILKLLMMIGMVVLYSCSSSQNITVKGTPGTEIYSPANTKLGVIDSAGELKVNVPNGGGFYHYLLSGKVGEGKLVPFALNYKHSGNHELQNAMIYGGASIVFSGAIIAGISVGTGEGETGDITAMGLGGMAVGALIGGIGQLLSNMNNGEYEYRYLSYQKTNEDLAFLPIQDTGYKKGVENVNCVVDDTPNRRVKASASVSSDNQTSASKRQIKKDVSKFVSGSYIGTGSLSQKGKIVEEYDLVKVLITRIDNANVLIDVVEGGESFFSSKIRYQVVQKGKNTYVLSLNGVPGASIMIDKNGRLTFKHPKVNIEGELYTLNINAEKEYLPPFPTETKEDLSTLPPLSTATSSAGFSSEPVSTSGGNGSSISTSTKKIEAPCYLCHGLKKCWTCNGSREILNSYTGNYSRCPDCTDGLCSHCHGTGLK